MPVQVVRQPSSIRTRSISGFSAGGEGRAARARLDANLGLRIDDLDRACSITEVQKKKLKLAGLGDIKRYYDRVEDLKRKYTPARAAPTTTTTSGRKCSRFRSSSITGFSVRIRFS